MMVGFIHQKYYIMQLFYLSRGSVISSISSVVKSLSSGEGGYAGYGQAPPIIQVLYWVNLINPNFTVGYKIKHNVA